MQAVKRPRPRSAHSFRPEVADETKSTDMVRGVDRIFTNTAKLSSEAIVDFVQALTDGGIPAGVDSFRAAQEVFKEMGV